MEDKGHKTLLEDIYNLFREAENFTFHDFKTQDATPKVNLVLKLQTLINRARNGRYDN